MRALLITACLLATVPSVEALASLPSISSTSGIAMALLSVAAALFLVVGVFKWVKRLVKRKKKPATQENVEAGQPQISPPQQSDSDEVHPRPPQEEIEKEFYEFLQEWKEHSIDEKNRFLNGLFQEFPVAVTPEMLMAALQKMLSEELHAELWMRMLRFIMMLERDLFRWDQTRQHLVREGDNTPTSRTHDEFQSFLITQAEDILRKHGDVARRHETAQAGFMRFVAYLFGFVCKYKRILELMDRMWTEHDLQITDASRAMVWGYRRWKDDRRFKCRPTAIEPNGNHAFFHLLMRALKATGPGPRQTVGNTAQHLLFALGCGYEPDPAEGPLAYMSDDKNKSAFCSMDYLWLMMGRDLVMGNAWHWMCKKGLSEHDRMCDLFGQKSLLYRVIVDMVMKYDENYDEENEENEECMENFAVLYAPAIKFDFGEHRNWYERYKREKSAISLGINAWLEKNAEQWEGKTMEAGPGTSTIRVAGVAAVRSNSNSKSSKRKSSSSLRCISE